MMARLSQPHDGLFRGLAEDPARARALALWAVPTEVAERMSGLSVEVVSSDFIGADLRPSRGDVLLAVRLSPGGKTAFHILIEQKSRPDPNTALQVEGYRVGVRVRQMREDGRITPIITVVVYSGPDRWTAELSVHGMEDDPAGVKAPAGELGYLLANLSQMPIESFPQEPGIRAVFVVMREGCARAISWDNLRQGLECYARIPDGDLLGDRILTYILRGMSVSSERLLEIAPKEAVGRMEASMATMWEVWTTEARAEGRAEGKAEGKAEGRAEGKVEGRAEGKVEGKAEGKAEVFLRLVAQRLGEVPEDMAARVRAAGAEDIDSWIDDVLDGRTVDEALNGKTMH